MRRAASLDLLAVQVRQQGLLAEPYIGLLHLRLPADVPHDLHGAPRPRQGAGRPACRRRVDLLRLGDGRFAVICACYTNIAMSVTFQRDAGVLNAPTGRRCRGLLPRRTGAARDVHRAAPRRDHLRFRQVRLRRGDSDRRDAPAIRRDAARRRGELLLRSASRSPRSSRTPTRSPAIVNATILPLLFLSGVFIPAGPNTPSWVASMARIFPVKHFASEIQSGFLATASTGPTSSIVAAWGLAGLLAAMRYFSLGAPHLVPPARSLLPHPDRARRSHRAPTPHARGRAPRKGCWRCPRHALELAPVDDEALPRDVERLVRGEEEGGVGGVDREQRPRHGERDLRLLASQAASGSTFTGAPGGKEVGVAAEADRRAEHASPRMLKGPRSSARPHVKAFTPPLVTE